MIDMSAGLALSNKKVFAPRFTSTGLFEHDTETLNVCKIAKEIVKEVTKDIDLKSS